MADRSLCVRPVLIALAATLSLACAADAPAPTDHARYYPLRLLAGSRLMVAAQINGHDVDALLDSAAEATFVDVRYARQIGLVAGQQVAGSGSGKSSFDVQLAPGVTLGALGVRIPDQTVGLTDLADVGKRLLGRPIDVILGRELFDAARLEVDIPGQRIRVLPAGVVPRGTRLALVAEHGVETVPVSVEGHPPVRATFDLGNGTHVLLARRYAEQLGVLKDGRAVQRERGGGLGGQTDRQVIVLRSLELAGREFTGVTAAIDTQDSASDVNVGIGLLRHFLVTTDFPGRAVWLAPL